MAWDEDADDEGGIVCRLCGMDVDPGEDDGQGEVYAGFCASCQDEVERAIDRPIDELTL